MNENSCKVLKPFRKEVRSLFRSVASKVWLVLALDPKFEEELARFRLLTPLKRYFESQQSSDSLHGNAEGTVRSLRRLGHSSKLRLRATRKELREQLCLLCEKAI